MTAIRRVIGQLGIDVPARLPGGVWGAPPLTITFAWDGNGFLLAGFGAAPPVPVGTGLDIPAAIAQQATMQAEMAWPQQWSLQVGTSRDRPLPAPPLKPIEVEFAIDLAVESSTYTWRWGVPWDGIDRLLPLDLFGVPAITLVAQRVRITPARVRAAQPEQALAGQVRRASFTFLLGLQSPPEVP